MLNYTSFKPNIGFEIARVIEFAAIIYGAGGGVYSYSSPVGGFVLNNEAEYDLITWEDARDKPTWAQMLTTYPSWQYQYDNTPVFNEDLQRFFAEIVDIKASITALNLKANSLDVADALALKENSLGSGTTGQILRGDKTWVTANKSLVGLNNLDNVSDANKPISSATQSALNKKVEGSEDNLLMKTFTGSIDGNSELVIAIAAGTFSSIKGVQGVVIDGSGNPIQGSFDIVKAASTTSVTLKFIAGKNQTVLLTGAFDTTRFSPTGNSVFGFILGVKA